MFLPFSCFELFSFENHVYISRQIWIVHKQKNVNNFFFFLIANRPLNLLTFIDLPYSKPTPPSQNLSQELVRLLRDESRLLRSLHDFQCFVDLGRDCMDRLAQREGQYPIVQEAKETFLQLQRVRDAFVQDRKKQGKQVHCTALQEELLFFCFVLLHLVEWFSEGMLTFIGDKKRKWFRTI